MKKTLLLLVVLFTWGVAQAQDLIIKRNGEEISAKILEITPELVKYQRADYLEGPLISILKKEVFMIKYANGNKETFNAPAPAVSTSMAPSNATTSEPQLMPHVKLSGPRLGFTLISGSLADKAKEEFSVNPFLTQFGWQFETRIFTTSKGLSGLFEFIPLVGGLEQGKFVPSLNAMVGLRGPKGFEFGVGPNLTPASAGVAFAIGTNFKSEGVNFPVNLAFVPGNGGARFSLLFGFNSRQF
ncbi:hypothetical protein [Rufibacter hautae]|uniref:Uncharacterized protein n=1 Tax=Rufibacter hautae TaxID=2595005 RepID=A0A5B6TGW7_9BACT|nr:hypothetical protein [Rufibacter hautae]KAA3438502.1 hypothetical protein FOA19_14810 [Rufibacter hautae]